MAGPRGCQHSFRGFVLSLANWLHVLLREAVMEKNDSAQRSASNECIRLIRKLRCNGMDDEAERVLAQLSGWPFRPTETVIAGPWATD
jgi:hypothetical protein